MNSCKPKELLKDSDLVPIAIGLYGFILVFKL